MSRHRDGTQLFGPKTTMKFATILGIPPENIADDMMATRAKDYK